MEQIKSIISSISCPACLAAPYARATAACAPTTALVLQKLSPYTARLAPAQLKINELLVKYPAIGPTIGLIAAAMIVLKLYRRCAARAAQKAEYKRTEIFAEGYRKGHTEGTDAYKGEYRRGYTEAILAKQTDLTQVLEHKKAELEKDYKAQLAKYIEEDGKRAAAEVQTAKDEVVAAKREAFQERVLASKYRTESAALDEYRTASAALEVQLTIAKAKTEAAEARATKAEACSKAAAENFKRASDCATETATKLQLAEKRIAELEAELKTLQVPTPAPIIAEATTMAQSMDVKAATEECQRQLQSAIAELADVKKERDQLQRQVEQMTEKTEKYESLKSRYDTLQDAHTQLHQQSAALQQQSAPKDPITTKATTTTTTTTSSRASQATGLQQPKARGKQHLDKKT